MLPALQGRGYATEAAAASRDLIGLRPEKRTAVHGGRDAVIYAASLGPQ